MALNRGSVNTPIHCHYLVPLTAAGSAVRAEFSDPTPGRASKGFHLTEAVLTLRADQTASGALLPLSTALTFAGQRSVSVGAARTVVSDPVTAPVQAGRSVSIDLTVDTGDRPSAILATDLSTCTSSGGRTAELNAPISWLSAVHVDSAAKIRTVGVLGDSITEGLGTALGSHTRWTDVLAAAGADTVNAGITGGRAAGLGVFGTPDGLTRLPALLAEPGLTDLVIALGTNDLGTGARSTQLLSTFDKMIAVTAAHHQIPVSISTITARAGSSGWTPAMELERLRVNATLRSGWTIPRGVHLVDLDAALRDPRHPGQLLAAYDFRDHVHLSVAGQHLAAVVAARALGLPAPANGGTRENRGVTDPAP